MDSHQTYTVCTRVSAANCEMYAGSTFEHSTVNVLNNSYVLFKLIKQIEYSYNKVPISEFLIKERLRKHLNKKLLGLDYKLQDSVTKIHTKN